MVVIQETVQQKKQLSFDMMGYFPPSLFIGVHGLYGNPEQLCHLLLGPVQTGPDLFELRVVHPGKIYHMVGAVKNGIPKINRPGSGFVLKKETGTTP